MPTQSSPTVQTLRRLLREYLECLAGFRAGDCEALRNAVRSVASLVGGELGRDALRIVEGDFEP
jgi:hypothetical protein